MDYGLTDLIGLTSIWGSNYPWSLYPQNNLWGTNSGLSFQNILDSITAYNSSWQNSTLNSGLLDLKIQAGLNSMIGDSAVVVPTIASLDEDGNISHYLLSGKKLVEATDNAGENTKETNNNSDSALKNSEAVAQANSSVRQPRFRTGTNINQANQNATRTSSSKDSAMSRAAAAYQRTMMKSGISLL